MKFLAPLFAAALLAFPSAHAAEKKKIVLFATFVAETPVELADGARWLMDAGDAFPVLMFKEQQTKVVLQLAGTNFIVPCSSVRIVQEKEITEELLASYRRNVVTYLEGRVKKWRETVQTADPAPTEKQ